LIVGAQIGPATASDAVTLEDSLHAAQAHLENAGLSDAIKEVAADKGYHSTQTLTALTEHTDYKTYIPEPKPPKGRRRNLRDRTLKERRAILNNRKRSKGRKGRELQRLRSEKVERSFAHTLETGDGRRTRLRGIAKNQKRYFILTAAYNLGVILRQLFGIGTARSLQGMKKAFANAFLAALWLLGWLLLNIITPQKSLGLKTRLWKNFFRSSFMPVAKSQKLFCSTGC
jgi:hypothetical protein